MATRDKSVWILIVFILSGLVIGGVKYTNGYSDAWHWQCVDNTRDANIC